MINDTGYLKLEDIDDLNVPVDCFMDLDSSGLWVWTASNYQPRRDRIETDGWRLESTSKDEILGEIRKRVIPVYQAAIASLQRDGTLSWDAFPG